MTEDDIIALPDPRLRQKSKRIHVITDETRQLADNMISAALSWEKSHPHEISAALSAVQIGHLERMVIVRSNLEDKTNKEFTVLINPEIAKLEGEVLEDFEGCLSVTSIYGKVPRHNKIRLKALDLDGNQIRLKAEGFLARVLQHEIDHINGKVFIDHIKDQPDAFYKLDEKGELQPLDYETEIATNHLLWD